ncbi:MAG: hypothetical protein ABFS34_00105 [Gemmatimonadota bacterium]
MRMRSALVALLLMAAPLVAQESRNHEVRKGDTLWDLAGHFYGDPFLWPCIHRANEGLVANPHLILPTWNLTIPPPGSDCREGGLVAEAAPSPRAGFSRTVFYPRPDDADAGLFLEDVAGGPIVSAREFLAAPWLSGAALPVERGRVLETLGREAPGSQLPETAHPHETVYLSGQGDAPEIGERLLVVRYGREVAGHGVVVSPRAVAAVTSVDGDVWMTRIIAQFDEVRTGDRAISMTAAPDLGTGRPVTVEDGSVGRLLGFVRNHPLPGSPDIGFVDLGDPAGVRVGDLIGLIMPERPAREDQTRTLPPELVAESRVIRVHEGSATVRVLKVAEPVLESGMVAQVLRRMP